METIIPQKLGICQGLLVVNSNGAFETQRRNLERTQISSKRFRETDRLPSHGKGVEFLTVSNDGWKGP